MAFPYGIYVSLVAPGPVDTEFDKIAGIKGGMKGGPSQNTRISAEECAADIIRQLQKNKTLILPGKKLRRLMNFYLMLPWFIRVICVVLVILLCSFTTDKTSVAFFLRLASVIILGTMIVTTVTFNVPINASTGLWDKGDMSDKWKQKRKLWHFFQGYRSIALILSFILLTIAQVII